MSERVIDAIYEDGVLRPADGSQSPLRPGQHVQIVVDDSGENVGADTLQLAAAVYEGLTEDEIAEIESIAVDRRRFSMSGTHRE